MLIQTCIKIHKKSKKRLAGEGHFKFSDHDEITYLYKLLNMSCLFVRTVGQVLSKSLLIGPTVI